MRSFKDFVLCVLASVFFGFVQVMTMQNEQFNQFFEFQAEEEGNINPSIFRQESPNTQFRTDLEQLYHDDVIRKQEIENKKLEKDVEDFKRNLIRISSIKNHIKRYVNDKSKTEEQKFIYIYFSPEEDFTKEQVLSLTSLLRQEEYIFFGNRKKADQSRIVDLINQAR